MSAGAVELQDATPSAEADSSRATRYGILAGWTLLAFTFLTQVATVLRAGHVWLVHQLPDDGFYYLEIGRRMADGDGFSFDGINRTDGFHPLWQYLLGGLAAVVPGGDTLLRAALILAVCLSFGAVLLVMRLARPIVGPGAVLVGALVAVHSPEFGGVMISGMEGPAVVMTLALLLTAVARLDRNGFRTGDAFLVGLATGLAILARLDLVVVLALVPLALLWRSRSARVLVAWFAGAFVLAGLWSIWHYVDYGHLATVSATVKQETLRDEIDAQFGGQLTPSFIRFTFAEYRWYIQWLVEAATTPALSFGSVLDAVAKLGVLITAAVGAGVLWSRRTKGAAPGSESAPPDATVDEPAEPSVEPAVDEAVGSRSWRSSAAFALGLGVAVILCKGLFDIWFSHPYARAWYAAPQIIGIPFLVGALAWVGVRAAYRYQPAAGVITAAALVIVLLPYSFGELGDAPSDERAEGFWQDELDRTADWLEASGPEGRYGAFDSGLLGYRLHEQHGVVNLDGRVNDFDHAEVLLDGADDRELVQSAGIDILINRLSPERLEALNCGEILWESEDVLSSGILSADSISTAPVYVIDVRDCRAGSD